MNAHPIDMLDRIATVIGQSLEMYDLIDPNKIGVDVALRFTAGVVFQALREATPEMLEAYYEDVPRGRAAKPLDHWHAMIDAGRKRHD